jgi:hypothetical protein
MKHRERTRVAVGVEQRLLERVSRRGVCAEETTKPSHLRRGEGKRRKRKKLVSSNTITDPQLPVHIPVVNEALHNAQKRREEIYIEN